MQLEEFALSVDCPGYSDLAVLLVVAIVLLVVFVVLFCLHDIGKI